MSIAVRENQKIQSNNKNKQLHLQYPNAHDPSDKEENVTGVIHFIVPHLLLLT